jgi:hypothetical protein
MRALLRRAIRAVKIIARDGAIPRPLRWLAAVGLLPIPGPFDEAILLLVAAILFVFYGPQLREAWKRAEGDAGAPVHPGGSGVSSRGEAGVSDRETR